MRLSICNYCQRAAGKDMCSWAKDFIPVEGWTAQPSRIAIWDGRMIDSYNVTRCPLFERDKPKTIKPKPKKIVAAKNLKRLNTYQLAAVWNVKERTIRGYTQEGMPYTKDGNANMFDVGECEKWYRTTGNQF